jgi:hypothetical protein
MRGKEKEEGNRPQMLETKEKRKISTFSCATHKGQQQERFTSRFDAASRK